MLNKFSLKGKNAVITGCSRGIGKSLAIGLAKAGANVIGIGYSNMDHIKKEIELLGVKFTPINSNLLEIDSIDKIDKVLKDKFVTIDILVNNAGIIRREDSLKFNEKDWDDVMNVNCKALFFLSQKVANIMVNNKTKGKIINIASMLSFQGGIRVPSYTASKSAVKGLTMLLANEWAKYDINVNAIAPGYIATDNTKALREDKDRNQAILNRIPANRWGNPEDLQGALIFLASNASNYVNGFTLAVDGGWLSR